jgi:hypothetical protein
MDGHGPRELLDGIIADNSRAKSLNSLIRRVFKRTLDLLIGFESLPPSHDSEPSEDNELRTFCPFPLSSVPHHREDSPLTRNLGGSSPIEVIKFGWC